jgi:hypothetical protein
MLRPFGAARVVMSWQRNCRLSNKQKQKIDRTLRKLIAAAHARFSGTTFSPVIARNRARRAYFAFLIQFTC